MNDKERILVNIIRNLYSTLLRAELMVDMDYSRSESLGGEHVHFVSGDSRDTVVAKGQLVLCLTNPRHDWAIGFVERVIDNNHLCLREIGTDRICEIDNEGFAVIAGLQELDLLDRHRWTFRQKVIKAFSRYNTKNEYYYRFGGLDFHADRQAVIWVREWFGDTEPFMVKIKWNTRTTIKAILATMREQGYGTHKFLKKETQGAGI